MKLAPIDWVCGIEARYIETFWPQAAPHLERALARGRGEYAIDDIRAAIEARDMQLWVYGKFAKVAAAAVTEIRRYPRKTVCVVILTGGDSRTGWKEAARRIEEWAKAQGCTEIRAYGRRGWARAVGWLELDTVTGKVLT